MAAPGPLPIQAIVAVAMLVICGSLAFVIPSIQTHSALQRIAADSWQIPPGTDPKAFATDDAKLLAVRQVTLLIGLALLEGVAFMGCIAYLLEGQTLALGVIGVAVALMLCKFPTENRVRAWLERQIEALEELRTRTS